MAGIALPTAAAILAACSDPKEASGNAGSTTIPLARRDKPVTLPLYDDNPAIADGMEIEKGATLEIFNWSDYFYKKVLEDFEKEYDVTYNWTTFNNMSEAKQKMQAGQVADVFFPTVDVLGQMVGAKLLQPLNHSYIPNMEANVWPAYWDGDTPFYDQGWRYTAPYVIYTTGVGYRRDVISDEEAADQGYDLLWNADYAGKVGLYDDYRETLSMAMLRDGITDINTGDQATIDAALDSLKELIPLDVRTSINGTYVGLSEGKYDVHHAWSGDMIGAQYYLPSGTSTDVLGYWYPADHAGVVGNDTIVVPSSSEHPVLAHTFINFLLDKKHGYENFTWNGYQPPFTSINPESLISGGDVPKSLPLAVVTEEDFKAGYSILELAPDDDDKWQDAWDEFNTSTG